MIYHFIYFILFLVMVLGICFIVPVKWRQVWLLMASYAFCISYGKRSFYILLCSTVVSYLFGIGLDRVKRMYPGSNKALACLWGGIFLCVLPLFFGRFSENSVFAGVGTSFYLLQEIGYLLDIYHGNCRAEKNMLCYALFIAFFPKLVSGPIERTSSLLEQLRDMPKISFDYERARNGLLLMLWGYFQKSIIADSLSAYVTTIYGYWEGYAGGTICLASIIFAFQLYADFAGYTNIAIGAAQTLGFTLQKNFEQPYLACSIKDFWRRWHISFSLWLRDYVYIPLGGSRKGTIRSYFNLMVTFIVSGIWHGIGLNYVVWGMIHGVFQIIENICSQFKRKTRKKSALGEFMKKVWVFIIVDVAWIFFRASGLKTALRMLYKIFFRFSSDKMVGDIFQSLHLNAIQIFLGFLCIILLVAVDLLHEKDISLRNFIGKRSIWVRWFCYMGILLMLTVVGVRRWGIKASNFIYTQF